MSLSEFVEMIVYKNLESVSKTINVGEENREKLNARILRLSEMKSESEITIEGLKRENEGMLQEIQIKTRDISKLQQSLQEMNRFNSTLQEKLENLEKLNLRTQQIPERGDSAFVRLSKTSDINAEKDKVLHRLATITANQTNIQSSCHQIKQSHDVGFSTLVNITQV